MPSYVFAESQKYIARFEHQTGHLDFEGFYPHTIRKVLHSRMTSMFMFVNLQDEDIVIMVEVDGVETRVTVPTGHAFLGSRDLIHGGTYYMHVSRRLYIALMSARVAGMKANNTYIPDRAKMAAQAAALAAESPVVID